MNENFKLINYKILRDVKEPNIANLHDAGIDLFVPKEYEVISLGSNSSVKIHSGIALEIPPNMVGMICNKSSMGILGLVVGANIIDSGYTGEIIIDVHNISANIRHIHPNQKLVQLLLLPKPQIVLNKQPDNYVLNDFGSNRKDKGFGSSGH